MEEKIKIAFLFIILFGGIFVFSLPTLAHPGNTASDGCHYCRTNCGYWGVAWNQRHCHGGGSYSPPSYTPPSYDYPSYTPSIPDCPYMSSYDSLSRSCKCYSGYVASGGKCISADQYCRDKYGFNSRHNILTDSCECSYGYVLSGGRCVDGDTVCHQKYGYYSNYNSLSEACECDYGYVFNSADQCVSRDDYCEDLYGYNAEYNILSSGCVCEDGYELQNNKCVEITPVIYSFYPTIVRAGESITVSGNNFGDYKGDVILNILSFGILGKISSLDIKSWNDNQIKFFVPEDKEPDEYYIRIEPSWTFSSKETTSKNKLEVLIPLPEIYSIYPLEVEIREEVTISGENFGDSKYGEPNLYIGNIKVSSGNITSWWENKIVFEVTDGLENGYVILKDNNFSNPTVIQGSYLEVLELEEDNISVYSFTPTEEEIITESEFQSSEELQSEPKQQPQSEQEFQPSEEAQLELQLYTEESQSTEKEQDRKGNIAMNNQEEQKQDKSILGFLASVFNAFKSFFAKLFR